MSQTTTIKVTKRVRDALRQLADADGVTLNQTIERLARRERQRRIGDVLAQPLTDDERAWVAGSSTTVGRLAGR